MSGTKLVSTVIVCASFLCVVRPAVAQDQVLWPSAWQGGWDSQHTGDCVGTHATVDDVCAGQEVTLQILFAQGLGGNGLDDPDPNGWSGAVTDTSMALSQYVEDWWFCPWHPDRARRWMIQGSRVGDTAIITTTWSLYVWEGCDGCGPTGCDGPSAAADYSHSCQMVTNMVRSTTVVACSPVPARRASWGTLKVRYR